MSTAGIAGFGRAQLSLVTRAQALTVLTEDQLEGRVRTGRLEIVRPGVYRIAGAAESWEQHVLAACLAGGDGAVASVYCAATLWGLNRQPELPDLEITVPRGRRARLPGVRVHTSLVMGTHHTSMRRGIPVTTVERTLCDLTWPATRWEVEHAVDDALRRRLTTLKRLERVFLDLATRGRRRSRVMRAILEARLPGFDPGDSDQEVKLARWITAAGLPRPVQQHRVSVGKRRYRLDLAYPAQKIAIEYDGWDAHRSRSSFDADRQRDAELEDAEWRVLHFTAKSTRDFVVEKVARALETRPPLPNM